MMFGVKLAKFELYIQYDATTHWTDVEGVARMVNELRERYPGLDELAPLEVTYRFPLEAKNNQDGMRAATITLKELRPKGEFVYACLTRFEDLSQKQTAIVGEFRYVDGLIVASRTQGFWCEGVKLNE